MNKIESQVAQNNDRWKVVMGIVQTVVGALCIGAIIAAVDVRVDIATLKAEQKRQKEDISKLSDVKTDLAVIKAQLEKVNENINELKKNQK